VGWTAQPDYAQPDYASECASLVMVVIVQMVSADSACVYCSSFDVFIYQRMLTVVEIKPEESLLSEMSCGRVNGSVAG
jgi:hypothetical protein